MDPALSDLSDQELLDVAGQTAANPPPASENYPGLPDLSDEQLGAVAVQQGLLQPEEAQTAIQGKKSAARKGVLDLVTGQMGPVEGLVAKTLLTRGGKVGDIAASTVLPIAGAVAGSVAPGPGTIAGGAAGGLAGESLVQARQFLRGERDKPSPGALGVATVTGGIPLGGRLLATPARVIATRAAQGGAIAGIGDVTRQLIDNKGKVNWGDAAFATGFGALFGAGAGGVEAAMTRKAVLRLIRQTPEFADFKGSDADLVTAVRSKLNPTTEAAEPRNVTGTAEPGVTTEQPTAAPVERPALPQSATEFENLVAGKVEPVEAPANAGPTPAKPIGQLTDAELLQVAKATPAEVPTHEPQSSPANAPFVRVIVRPRVTLTHEPQSSPANAPVSEIPVQIQGADGSIQNAVLNGFWPDHNGHPVPSIGYTLPNGTVSHGMLKPDEKIISPIATAEQWDQGIRTQTPEPTGETPAAQAPGVEVPSSGSAVATQETNPAAAGGPVPAGIVVPPQSVKKGNRRTVGMAADGESDLLNDIEAAGGIGTPDKSAGGEYDGYKSAFGEGRARLLRNTKAQKVDQLVAELNGTGRYNFGSVDEFYAAVKQAADRRLKVESDVHLMAREGKVAAALFDNRGRPAALKAKQGVNSDTLNVGDSLKVNGEPVRVIDVNPDTGAVKIKNGVEMEVPPDTLIYPDKGRVKKATPAEGANEIFENGAQYNANLARELNQLRTASQSRALTPEESARLDTLDRTLGQDFFDFADGDKGATTSLGNEKDLKRAELQRRAEARLQAPGLESQIDLLGPTTDKEGQFSLFENEAARYLDSKGITDPIRRAAVRDLLKGVWERRAEGQLQLDLGSDAKLADDLAAISRIYPRPLATSGQLGDAFGSNGNGISELDRLAGSGPVRLEAVAVTNTFVQEGHLKLIGQRFPTTAAFVAAAQILRNSAVETFWLLPFDEQKRLLAPYAITSRMPSSVVMGSEFASELGAHLRAVKADSWQILHNHPSGDINPSDADRRFTKYLAGQLINNVPQARFEGHIVINHGRYAIIDSFGNSETEYLIHLAEQPDPQRMHSGKAPYLGARVDNQIKTIEIGYALQVPDGNVLLHLVGVDGTARGIASISTGDITSPEIATSIIELGRNIGANYSIAYTEAPNLETRRAIAKLQESGVIVQAAYKHDGEIMLTNPTYKGGFFGTKNTAENGLRVAEEETPYDSSPVIVTDKDGNVIGDQKLGGLELIKPVEMPELVKLVRDLTGAIPGLKNFPKARGMFYGMGKGAIKLNRTIFADPIQAQKTLAHEIGHLIDYLPDHHLERGNLLGRLAVLRQHLASTLPHSPNSPHSALTAKERAALYRAAAQAMGSKRPSQEEDPAGWGAWGARRSELYREMIEEQITARKLIRAEVVRSELIDLSAWWRPWDRETASEGFAAYRDSSVELYADALGVLLNAPPELKERAPIFWQAWFNYLDRKPEAKTELFDLWTFLHRGKLGVLAQRNARLKASFEKGDETFLRKAAERDARQNTMRGIIDSAKQKHFDIFAPIIMKARAVKASGRVLPWQNDPEYVFDAHPLADNETYLLLDRMHKKVIQPIEAAGMTTDDLGLYLFHSRVLNEAYEIDDGVGGRTVLANPQGITPIQARQALLKMRLDFGPDRMAVLEASARKFQDEAFAIVEKGGEAGIYSPENVAMARANRYNYATFAVLDYLEESAHIPAAIRQQRGTLADIANPFTATLIKSMTALKLIEHNTNKRVAVKLLQDHFPAAIERAPETKLVLTTGKVITRTKHAPAGKEELVTLVDGKPQTYFVDPEIAKMFDRLMPASAHAVVKALNWSFRKIIYPVFITYNPAFQLYLSPLRDLRRSYVNLPAGVSRRKWLGQQLRTWEAAKSRLLNDTTQADLQRRRTLRQLAQQRALTPAEKSEQQLLDNRALVIETLATRAIGSPFDSFVRNPTREDYFGRLLQDYELLPPDKQAGWRESNVIKPFLAVGNWIERTGMSFEALPKLSTYRVLTRDLGWPAHQAAEYVRNHVGVPNYLRRGEWATIDGTVLPFINVFMQGYASDLKQARGRALGPVAPGKQKFEWWRRMAENTLVPRLLQALAAAGVLGAALKELYDGVAEHDKANYTIIPLGQLSEPTESGHGKVAYIRIPEDETARLLGGVIHYLVQKAANGDPASHASLTDLASFAGGQVPSINPIITQAAGWTSYLSGQNPVDQFRGEKVLSNVEFNAGGWAGTKGMLAWSWRETGGANFVRWDPKSDNVLEFTASAIPGLNRMIKVTDAGFRERQQTLETSFNQRNARIRVAMPDSVNALLGEYYSLSALSAEVRSPLQSYRLATLSKWHSKVWEPNYKVMQQTDDASQWKQTGQVIGEMSDAWKK